MVDSVLQKSVMWWEFYKKTESAMEDDAIMLPSGCALAYVSLVFGIKGEFHQNWLVLLFCKGATLFFICIWYYL